MDFQDVMISSSLSRHRKKHWHTAAESRRAMAASENSETAVEEAGEEVEEQAGEEEIEDLEEVAVVPRAGEPGAPRSCQLTPHHDFLHLYARSNNGAPPPLRSVPNRGRDIEATWTLETHCLASVKMGWSDEAARDAYLLQLPMTLRPPLK